MKFKINKLASFIVVLSCVLALSGLSENSQAQEYPNRPIKMIIPFSPGGASDLVGRILQTKLGDVLGQPIIIENKPGASGNIGMELAAKSAPDGYTLFLGNIGTMAINPALYPNIKVNPLKDFISITEVVDVPSALVTNASFPVNTVAELITYLKANPGKFNYASSGSGSSNQFATELLKAMSGTYALHIPYRGMGPATTDLIGGQTQILFASGPSLLPQVRNGRIRAIGITSLKPSPIAPELIPMATVVPGYEFELWWGILGPAGMPADIVNFLNLEINKILNTPDIKAALLREGAESSPETPAQFASRVSGDIVRWIAVAKRQNITGELR